MTWLSTLLKIAMALALIAALIVAYQQGARSERLIWQEKQMAEFQKRELARVASEARIATIEQTLINQVNSLDQSLSGLETAIQEQANEPPDNRGGCPPALSRRLRDELQKIGN